MELPLIKRNELGVGDVMIGHHLLIIPALLLDKKIRLDEGSFLDFCTLVNAVTLHDRLVTLPATLPEDLEELQLYKYLTKEKRILYELDPTEVRLGEEDREQISYLLFGRKVSNKEDVYWDEIKRVLDGTIYYDELRRDYTEDSVVVNPELDGTQQKNFVTDVINSTVEEQRGVTSKLASLLRTRLSPIRSRLSVVRYPLEKEETWLNRIKRKGEIADKDELLRLHRLRTAEYYAIAGKLNIPFLPDFMRIPAIAGYQGHLIYAIRYLIQNSFDKLVIKELLEIDDISQPVEIPIPDGTSNFLNKYRSSGSIGQSFNELRQEFAKCKDKIVEWERKEKVANRLEKLKIRRKISSTIKSSLKEWGISDVTDITASMFDSLTPGVLTGQVPAAPGSQPIFKIAIDFSQVFLAKKRVGYFLSGHKEAAKIKNQDDLLKYAFNSTLSESERNNFLRLTESLHSLTGRASTKYIKTSKEPIIPRIEKQPLDIIKERVAKGEITLQDFDDIRSRIE